MKQIKGLAVLLAFSMLTGCASVYPVGAIFTGVNLPVAVTSNSSKVMKNGTAECHSLFAMFAYGDCSFDAAKKDGNITKMTHADWQVRNIFGIFGSYKLIVYGE